MPHPQGCLAYRIEADGHVFVYATDVELSAASLSREVARYLKGADVLCLDAQYTFTPDEYEGRIGIPKKGWGHSTMVDAAEVAKGVGARRLLPLHHEPSHSDSMVERMAQEACNTFAASEPAREGQRIFLGPSSSSRTGWAAACCPSTEAPRPAGTSPPGTDPQRRPARGPQPEPDACQESRLPGQPRCSGMARAS